MGYGARVGTAPFAKWFVGGKINYLYNCLDRHLATWRQNKAAFIWEGEPGETANAHLSAAASRSLPLCECSEKAWRETGDRVALYMPLVPELAIAMLACARIGATHTVIFGGFSADAIRDRVNDGQMQTDRHGGRRLSARQRDQAKADVVDEAVAQMPDRRERRRLSTHRFEGRR